LLLGGNFGVVLSAREIGLHRQACEVAPPGDFVDRRHDVVDRAVFKHVNYYQVLNRYDDYLPVKWLRITAEKGNPSYTMFTRVSFLDGIRRSPDFIQFMEEIKPQYERYRSESH
jgi:hypothetical protein